MTAASSAATYTVNRKQDTLSNGASNRTTFVYGGHDRAVSHDARGNTDAIGANSYGYDSENRLTSGPGGTTLSYDPLGRLYQVTSGSRNERFLYDGDQVMSVYGPYGNVTEFPVHGEEPNSPLLTYDSTGRAWSHPDERGSVVARSNDAGTVTAVNRYDEYGAPQGGSVAGLFGYTGQAWLPELGMYDYHARLYNPGQGRFMQTDLIGYAGGPNLYEYVGGDSINFLDPFGLTWRRICAGTEGNVTCGWHWVEGGTSGGGAAALLGSGRQPGDLGSGDGGVPAEGPSEAIDCRNLPRTGYLTAIDAGIAGVQAARAEQRAMHDQNERGFALSRAPSGLFGFSAFERGSPDDIRYPFNRIGGGHTHTIGGGNRLSSSGDISDRFNRGDRDFLGRAMDLLSHDGSVANTLVVLGAENGDVRIWTGRNLTGDGRNVGSDRCE